jgi:hypothetical protein
MSDWYPHEEENPTGHQRWVGWIHQYQWKVRKGDVISYEWRDVPVYDSVTMELVPWAR